MKITIQIHDGALAQVANRTGRSLNALLFEVLHDLARDEGSADEVPHTTAQRTERIFIDGSPLGTYTVEAE